MFFDFRDIRKFCLNIFATNDNKNLPKTIIEPTAETSVYQIYSSKRVWHNVSVTNQSLILPCTQSWQMYCCLCLVFGWNGHEVLNQEFAFHSVPFVKQMAPYGNSEIRNKCYIFNKKIHIYVVHTYLHKIQDGARNVIPLIVHVTHFYYYKSIWHLVQN